MERVSAHYGDAMNENAKLEAVLSDLVYGVLAACSFRDDNSPAGLSLTVLYKSPALDKARELVADAEDKEIESMLK